MAPYRSGVRRGRRGPPPTASRSEGPRTSYKYKYISDTKRNNVSYFLRHQRASINVPCPHILVFPRHWSHTVPSSLDVKLEPRSPRLYIEIGMA